MAVVSSWHLKRDLAKIPNVSFPPGTRRTVAPAMLRACRHNRGGVAVLPGGCLPYLPLLKPGGKRGQLSTSVGLSGWPPEVFKFEGGWAGIVGGGVLGPSPRWHGAASTGNQRLLLAELLPHEQSHSSFTKGSKNIRRIIKGSRRTAYALTRLFGSLKSAV